MRNTFVISEYDSLICEKKLDGYTTLPKTTFDQLEEFILNNRNNETDALELMGISSKKGIGKVITAKNYVGVISMNDGTTIEILPKIYSNISFDSKEEEKQRAKDLLVKMIRTLRTAPYKSFQMSFIDTKKMNVFEIYIRMFIDEVFRIVKRGLKNDYQTVERNEEVIKGKLVFSEHIKRNLAHKEKVFVQYDEFNPNRPENKLIRSTIEYLYKKTASIKNKADLKVLKCYFEDIEESVNYKDDLSKCKIDRNMTDYKNAIMWCSVFLAGKSFTSFSGSSIAYALLFPMETLFESYVAKIVRENLDELDYSLKTQDRKYHLFEEPSKKFLIKPDIVIKDKHNGSLFLFDTKWKILSDKAANYGISQSDMYQMYAYQKKYNANSVTLVYPKTDKVKNDDICFKSEDDVTVYVRFIDLFNSKESVSIVLSDIFNTI